MIMSLSYDISLTFVSQCSYVFGHYWYKKKYIRVINLEIHVTILILNFQSARQFENLYKILVINQPHLILEKKTTLESKISWNLISWKSKSSASLDIFE